MHIRAAIVSTLVTLLFASLALADTKHRDTGDKKPYEGDDPGECSDGADNDRDGQFDCDDAGCQNAPACTAPEPDLSVESPIPQLGTDRAFYPLIPRPLYHPGFGLGTATGGGVALLGTFGLAPIPLPSLWLPSLIFRFQTTPINFVELELLPLDDLVLLMSGTFAFHFNVRIMSSISEANSPHAFLVGYGLNTGVALGSMIQTHNLVLGYEASLGRVRLGFSWENGGGLDYLNGILVVHSLVKFRFAGMLKQVEPL